MSYKPTYKKSDWLGDCDICGFTYKASQLELQWDQLRACRTCFTPRQPQDFVKSVKDDSSVAWTRSEPVDIETKICDSRSAVSGIAQAGCMIAGRDTKNTLIPSGTFDMAV